MMKQKFPEKISKKMTGFILMIVLVLSFTLYGCSGNDTKDKGKDANETGDSQISSELTPTSTPEGTEDTAQNSVNADSQTASGSSQLNVTETAYKMQMGTVSEKEELLKSEDFENGQTDFTGRGDAKVEIVKSTAAEGSASLHVTGRTATWNGATVDMTKSMTENQKYKVEADVYYEEGPDSVQIDCKVTRNDNEYLNFATSQPKKGVWTHMEGTIDLSEGTQSAGVYFETGYGGNDTTFIDFYIDNVKISKYTVAVDRGDIPALKDVYKDNFSMGVAISPNDLNEENNVLIIQQFNSITPGNELKPDYILDYDTSISDPKYDNSPAVHFDSIKPLLDFAQKNGLHMRGHTLVWHGQTPRWFFTVGYSKDANAPLVTKELMLQRLENYIKQVMQYTQKNYPGVIYAWDVVNEAIEPGDGEEGGYRSKISLWYQTIGAQFLEKAFEFSRKYADPNVKLFYNDYNTEDYTKMMDIYNMAKGLKEKGLIDGIGLQSHISISSPSIIKIQDSIQKYAELGLEIQLTELDMGMTENTDNALMDQAKRYKRLFLFLKNLDDKGIANITNVTFWGLADNLSWLNKPDQPSYPLLFDKFLVQKPAFWGVVLSPDIPLY